MSVVSGTWRTTRGAATDLEKLGVLVRAATVVVAVAWTAHAQLAGQEGRHWEYHCDCAWQVLPSQHTPPCEARPSHEANLGRHGPVLGGGGEATGGGDEAAQWGEPRPYGCHSAQLQDGVRAR